MVNNRLGDISVVVQHTSHGPPLFFLLCRWERKSSPTKGRRNWYHMRGLLRFDELRQHPADMAIFEAVMTANAASKRRRGRICSQRKSSSTHADSTFLSSLT